MSRILHLVFEGYTAPVQSQLLKMPQSIRMRAVKVSLANRVVHTVALNRNMLSTIANTSEVSNDRLNTVAFPRTNM